MSAITEFAADFRGAIDGNREDIAQNELSGGARISFVFHELYNNAIKSFDPFDQIKDGDIRTLLYNSSVRSLTVLVNPTLIRVSGNSGLNSESVRWDCCFRDHCQTTDPKARGTELEVLPAHLRRVD